MSIETLSAKLQQLLRELEQLQRRLESESREEASAADRLSQSQRWLTSSSSPTSAMRQADADRKARDLLSIQQKRASTQQAVAAKQADLSRVQLDLHKAQIDDSRRRADTDQRLRREQETRERSLRSQLEALRSAPPVAKPTVSSTITAQYDLFISHATEDKEEVGRPLAQLLRDTGLRVWYDEFVLTVGDSLRRKIDEGLAHSRFGVVVLSPSFFAKNWPQYELDGLVATENTAGQKVILPIWHRLTRDEVLAKSPTLADRVALNTSVMSLTEIADALASVVRDAA